MNRATFSGTLQLSIYNAINPDVQLGAFTVRTMASLTPQLVVCQMTVAAPLLERFQPLSCQMAAVPLWANQAMSARHVLSLSCSGTGFRDVEIVLWGVAFSLPQQCSLPCRQNNGTMLLTLAHSNLAAL